MARETRPAANPQAIMPVGPGRRTRAETNFLAHVIETTLSSFNGEWFATQHATVYPGMDLEDFSAEIFEYRTGKSYVILLDDVATAINAINRAVNRVPAIHTHLTAEVPHNSLTGVNLYLPHVDRAAILEAAEADDYDRLTDRQCSMIVEIALLGQVTYS